MQQTNCRRMGTLNSAKFGGFEQHVNSKQVWVYKLYIDLFGLQSGLFDAVTIEILTAFVVCNYQCEKHACGDKLGKMILRCFLHIRRHF